jgi:hypothetical protein
MLSEQQKITYIKTYIHKMKGVNPRIVPPRNAEERNLLNHLYHVAKHKVTAMGAEIRV